MRDERETTRDLTPSCKRFANRFPLAYISLMSRRRCLSFILAALFLSSLATMTIGAPARPKIITTISPLFCWAKNVAGSAADVENLLPPGVSAHDYQLSPKDRSKLEGAQLIVFNGLELEGVLEERLRGKNKPAAVDA